MLVLDMEFMKFGTFPRKPLLVMNSLPCISRTPTLVVLTVFHLELSPEMWPLLVTEEVSGSVLLLKLTVYVWWYSHPWGSRSGAFSLPPLGGLTGVSGCPCGSLPQSAVATITCERGVTGRHRPHRSCEAVLHCCPLWMATVHLGLSLSCPSTW